MKINLFNLVLLAILSAIVGFFTSFGLIVAICLLIFLPGLAILELLLPSDIFKRWEKGIASFPVGFAFISFIFYIYSSLGVEISTLTIGATVFSLLVLLFYFRRKEIKNISFFFQENLYILVFTSVMAIYAVIVFAFTSGMNTPLFADTSLQGTIVRLFMDQGGIPSSWKPYAPLSFHYQPGFAAGVTWVGKWVNLSIPKLLLYFTNIIHFLFPAAVFLFSRAITKNWKYNFLVFFFSIASLFPLALFRSGSNASVLVYLLVPAYSAIVIKLFKENNKQWLKTGIFLTVSFTGGLLIHPLFGFLMVLLFIPFAALEGWSKIKSRLSFGKILIISTVLACIIAGTFLFSSTPNYDLMEDQWEKQARYMNPRGELSSLFFIEPIYFLFNNPRSGNIMESWYFYLENFSVGQFLDHTRALFLVLILFTSLWMIYKKRFKPGIYGVILYLFFLFFSWIQSTYQFKFPGWQAFYPTRVKFIIIIPLALIMSSIIIFLRKKNILQKGIYAFLGAVLIFSMISNGIFLNNISNLGTVGKAEKEAFEWIEENTKTNDLFVNRINEVDSGVFIGGSAQWIPAFTGNPILYPSLSLTENVGKIEDRLEVMEMMEKGEAGSERFLSTLKKYGADYIYLSYGRMHSPTQQFDKIELDQFKNPNYELVFNEGVVYIFSINY